MAASEVVFLGGVVGMSDLVILNVGVGAMLQSAMNARDLALDRTGGGPVHGLWWDARGQAAPPDTA